MIRTLFFLLALATAQTVSCQAVFQRSYGGYGSDYGRAVIECSDGGYLVVGSTNSFMNESTDIYLLRVDEAGEFLWGKNIGLPDHIEWGVDLEEDSDGNFILTGYTDATPSGSYDGMLVKTDHFGNVIWEKTYGSDDWDFFESMTLTSEGNILVCGQKTVNGEPHGWILMTSADGIILWETLIPGNGKVNFTGLDICPSGIIVFTGYIENTLLNTKKQISGSLNMSGAIIWASTFPEFGSLETGRCVCGNSNDLNTISTIEINEGNTSLYVSVLDGIDGSTIALSEFPDSLRGEGHGVTIGHNGNLLIASGIDGFGYNGRNGGVTSLLIFENVIYYASSWIFGGENKDILYDIKSTSDGGFISVGETNSFEGNWQILLCKVDSLGIKDENNINYIDTSTKIPFLTKPAQFNTYPNPAKTEIHIDFEINNRANYKILDLTGKILRTGTLSSGKESIDVSRLNSGMYFIQIKMGNHGRLLSRFVKIN